MATPAQIPPNDFTYIWSNAWNTQPDGSKYYSGGSYFFIGQRGKVRELGLNPNSPYKFSYTFKYNLNDPIQVTLLVKGNGSYTTKDAVIFSSDHLITLESDEISVGEESDYVEIAVLSSEVKYRRGIYFYGVNPSSNK
ncbi:uncharacterized protein LOC110027624 isoform X2 [Phalaenopsis equestris]|uniref:uncharacterized protein LOC110027624 isoform X2 n=1 Tax=Phalaenopsis equestris TaxID=78828 RepID=UPI0009E20BE3|nr:uncharacterized protein LOC110027624 isoform X2 [Phalaenopsis equestris]